MKKVWLSLCLVLLALPASAQMDWSIVGSGGVVDESSTSLYQFTGATIEFKAGQTGTITVRYPITAYGNANGLQPPWDTLKLTGIDDSASGSVTVKLISVDECSGEEEELCSVNASGTCSICLFPPNIDFTVYSYYLEGTLTRSSTSANESITIISLGY